MARSATMRFMADDLVVDKENKAPLQILCAGLPRCATSSIQAALESEHIGLHPCMHMAHVIPHADRSTILLEAMRETNTERRQKLLYQLFDGYQASADFPGCGFIDDLMDMYPDAKIVLNKRPDGGEGWAKSIKLLSWAAKPSYYFITFLWKTDRNLHHLWVTFLEESWAKVGISRDDMLTAKHYEAHNAWVRAEAAKRGREVLEFEPGQGWGPLCAFAGKEAPTDEPYPHRNDASEIRMLQRILYARGIISWLALVGASYGAARWFGVV